MRTALAALAALAAVTSSMAAVPAFDKADCGSMTSNVHTATLAGVANGEWSCVTFSVGLDSQQLVKLDMESRWLGYTLQVMLWNNGQVAGDTAANTWRDSSAGRGVLDWIKAQNGQNDINGLPAAHNARYSNISAGVGLTVTNGWSGDVVNYRDNGVYAMRGSVKPAPGRNTFIISNPDAAAPGGTFGGSFMYRLVNMNTADNLYSLTGLTATQVNAHWGQLATGSPVTIPNVLLPGTGFTVPISDTWAKVGFGLKGLKYTVSIAPGGSTADVAQDRMGWADPLPFPNGYSTTAGMEKSFTDVSPGSLIKNQPWAQTRLSSTNVPLTGTEELWYDYSSGAAAWGPWNGTQTYGSNSISIDWQYPVDVTSNPGGTFAYLSINTPVVQNDVDATVRPYDWTGQSSPFWDVTVTIDRVDEYPLLGSESNVELSNKNNKPVDGHNAASTATDPATGPYKIYRVGTSNPLWWRMIVNMNNVVDKNLPAGTTEEGPACPPHWDYQVVQDANNGHNNNGWGEEWFNLRKDAGGYGAEDFWASNLDAKNDDIDTANGWLTNDEWRDSSQALVSSARNTLLPKFDVGRNTWLLVRVSATSGFVDNGVKSCGSNHVTIGSLSASWDTVDDQCADYTDCLVATADNPNADQDGDSANRNARRFSNCYLYQKPGSNYRWVPTTKCVECFASWQCGEGQYCHLDDGTASFSWGPYNGAFTEDADSAKLFGTCQQKSTDVLGKRCRTLTGGSSGSRMSSYFPAAGTGSAVTVQNGAAVRNGAASPIDLLVAMKGDADNADFAEGANGACGEFRYVNGRDPNTGSLVDNDPNFISAGSGTSLVRIALWTGFCDSDQVCRECVPGSTGASSGKVCLNGRSFSAMDVDDTVRSFGQNTVASTELGTTAMIILLIILFAAHMYTEAKRWRHANGLPPMTCCECLCCCGCCSKLGGEAKEPAKAPPAAPAPAPASAPAPAPVAAPEPAAAGSAAAPEAAKESDVTPAVEA